jgi:hypothetical protein
MSHLWPGLVNSNLSAMVTCDSSSLRHPQTQAFIRVSAFGNLTGTLSLPLDRTLPFCHTELCGNKLIQIFVKWSTPQMAATQCRPSKAEG